ncbi:hypothetical protein [Canibacter zhuwentaonis]|nr:hypothetical protein [Canibacter zhuwentaonis]
MLTHNASYNTGNAFKAAPQLRLELKLIWMLQNKSQNYFAIL